MASIVAYIELREGAITRPSRFAVAEARRIANSAGATVFALLTVGPLAQADMDRLACEISAAGADRILCSSSDTLGEPALDATHGALLAQVAEHLRPVLFLFPAGGTGVQLGPPLAVRIGAAYMANARITVKAEGREPDPNSQRVILSKWRAARDGLRKIDVGDLERPVVASLISGSFQPPAGEPYAEVEMVPCPDAKFPEVRVIASKLDSATNLELCSAVVWSGCAGESAKAALLTELPAGACLVTADEVGLPAPGTTPQDCFVLPSGRSRLAAPLPWMVAKVILIQSDRDSASGTTSKDVNNLATAADADLAEFAAALRRTRSQEETS
jgi:electron transfer flavoprotein alpha subunit